MFKWTASSSSSTGRGRGSVKKKELEKYNDNQVEEGRQASHHLHAILNSLGRLEG